MAKAFNPNKSYGEVIAHRFAHFDQGGQLYNIDRLPIDEQGKLLPLDERSPVPQVPLPAATAPENGGAQTDEDTPEDEKIDLGAWARGEIKVHWPALQSVVLEKTGEKPISKDHARELIAKLASGEIEREEIDINNVTADE